mmetsp:Transcript_4730/g.13119  ORF Transcript_4730/g.13119 Transcript_4730/m.13119 type:complete len:462 (-) Transcript_4730:256-1641(-)|eukprot:CAMPEP_0117679106 /NCGR_PEP_ID=MMETSP0804-20121206/17646_1 /TAXON_ID=1074897 /ORGANISM="Tetraselmis astigmatica, Strain CCMP880" /LENGTH=461 /DNA_ID=CAMNT_0005488523 /DNA_START=313 /DNA_END=1698 /DNA_ORIENTATION=+
MLGSEADQQQVGAFVQALQLYQLLEQINATMPKVQPSLADFLAVTTPASTSSSQPPPRSAAVRLPASTASSFAAAPPPSLRLPQATASSPNPRIGPSATPPPSVDSTIASRVLAQLQAKVTESEGVTALRPSLPLKRADSHDTLPAARAQLYSGTSSPQSVLSFSTPPQKRKVIGMPPEASCPSPVDSLPSGLKRMRVRVLQSNTDPSASSPGKCASSPAASLMEHLVARSITPKSSANPDLPPRAHLSKAPKVTGKQHRLKSFAERLKRAEESENRAPGSWSEAEKQELVRVVAELKPCGAGDWERVAMRLNKNRPEGNAPRRGPSAERMYRTLTDPDYSKSGNPHGRRLNPRKGSTPMHVMATYSLQQLPDNEGNLTQITQLISTNERFAAELDWTPRPGTKTYPRWKDALVGCFKPGRYPHLMKTDRKRDGLTIYKLVKNQMGQTQQSTPASKSVAAS